MTATLSEFDQLVAGLMDRGFSRAVAEAEIRRQRPHLAPAAPELREDAIEDEHVDAGDEMMLALGFTVIRLSQKRASKITAGVPDRRYYHPRRKIVLWWEAKSNTGRQRPEQRVFQELCDAVGDPYVLGPLESLKKHLVAIGVVERYENGLPVPTPP